MRFILLHSLIASAPGWTARLFSCHILTLCIHSPLEDHENLQLGICVRRDNLSVLKSNMIQEVHLPVKRSFL